MYAKRSEEHKVGVVSLTTVARIQQARDLPPLRRAGIIARPREL